MSTGARECVAGECVRDVTGWPGGWQIVALVVIVAGAFYAYRLGRD